MNWASWVAAVDPLVGWWTMPWALSGSRAGTIRSTVIVEVKDEENIRGSRHIRLDRKTGVTSTKIVRGSANFSRCMVATNWSKLSAGFGS